MKYPTDPDTGEYLNTRDAITFTRLNGSQTRPDPPRNLQYQPGSRKALVTFDAPTVTTGIVGYKFYVDSETSLLDTVNDPNVRQYSIPSSAGATPPTRNVFISSFTKNNESVKVQIQVKATAEAGAPVDPTPPPGSAASGTTGKTLGFDGGEPSELVRTR